MSDPPRSLEDPDWPLIDRWRRAHREQEEVCQEIFERHWRKVAGLFRRKGHPADRVQALTQETFLRVFKELGSFRRGTVLVVWILLIALRVHFSEIRKETSQLPADMVPP